MEISECALQPIEKLECIGHPRASGRVYLGNEKKYPTVQIVGYRTRTHAHMQMRAHAYARAHMVAGTHMRAGMYAHTRTHAAHNS